MIRPDVLDHLEGVLAEARDQAARAVDRADAAAELRSMALRFAAERGSTTLAAEDLWRCPHGEEETARLRALIDRALPGTANTRRNTDA